MTSQDEPAIFDGLKAVIVQLIAAVCAASGFALNDDTKAAIASAAALLAGALVSIVQGYLTRSKVFSPATVEQLAPGATGDPVLEVPLNR